MNYVKPKSLDPLYRRRPRREADAITRYLSEWLLAHFSNRVIRALGRSIYGCALALLTHRLKKVEGLDGLFLRRGMASGDWVPGASDFDIAVVLTDSSEERRVAEVYRVVHEFGRWCPIPVDAEVFRGKELDDYLCRGNTRAMEAPLFWRPLYGSRSLETTPRSPFEVAVHSYSEALEQYRTLVDLAATDPVTRKAWRDLIKHFSDVLVFCRFAETGKFNPRGSRLDRLPELLTRSDEAVLLGDIFACVHAGYRPARDNLAYRLAETGLRRLHHAAQSPLLASIPPAWEVTAAPNRAPTTTRRTLWSRSGQKALAQGVELGHLHFHKNIYLVVSDETVESGRSFMKVMSTFLKRYSEFPISLVVTEPVLRVLYSTFFHQKNAPHLMGSRLPSRQGAEMEWIKSLRNEAVEVSENAKEVCEFAYRRFLKYGQAQISAVASAAGESSGDAGG